MIIIHATDIEFMPASHENSSNPGVLKRILFKKKDISSGWIQMINWCKLLPNRSFEAHYHETMNEIFIIIAGNVEVTIGNESAKLSTGDAIYIPQKVVHRMKNLLDTDSLYIAIGIATEEGGRSINT